MDFVRDNTRHIFEEQFGFMHFYQNHGYFFNKIMLTQFFVHLVCY